MQAISMDSWSPDLVLNVLSFLSLKELNRLSQASSRYYYLIYHYRRLRGPEFVAASSHTPDVSSRQKTAAQVVKEALSRLQTPPNLALGFSTVSNTLAMKLPALLPDNTISLNAVSSAIQSNIDGCMECRSHASLMLASLSPQRAHIHSFCLEGEIHVPIVDSGSAETSRSSFETLIHTLQQQQSTNNNFEWEVFLVYVCGAGNNEAESFVTRLQAHFPKAAIVGGICSQGCVTLPVMDSVLMSTTTTTTTPPSTTRNDDTDDHEQQQRQQQNLLRDRLLQMRGIDLVDLQKRLGGPEISKGGRPKKELVERVLETIKAKMFCLHMVEDGIFGVALGGEVPVRLIVSRGVQSLTRPQDADEQQQCLPSTNFLVRDVEFHRPGEEQYLFRFQDQDDSPPYNLVRTVYDQETGKTLTPNQLLNKFGQPDFIGLQRSGEDGFELHMPHPISYNINAFLFLCQGLGSERSFQNANFDLFDLDGKLCLTDMEAKMESLRLATVGEQILGAIMYSCSGRGPMPNRLMRELMADASRFEHVFPRVPLLGLYAGGEIGPLALAGRRQSVFQAGNATLQGFTAVFAVFIVPKVDLGTLQLDDREENVQALIRERLGRVSK